MFNTIKKIKLRSLSNKREVFSVNTDGEKYIFKCFYSPYDKSYNKELQIYDDLEASFNLARLIEKNNNDEIYLGGIIQYEFINFPAASKLIKTNPEVVDLIILCLEQLNSFNYEHKDPHLDNFLIDLSLGKVYLIDLSSLIKKKTPPNLDNSIALLLGQIPLADIDKTLEIASYYKIKENKLKKIYNKRKNSYFKKVLRTSSVYTREKIANLDCIISTNGNYRQEIITSIKTNKKLKQYTYIESSDKHPEKTWQIICWMFLSEIISSLPIAMMQSGKFSKKTEFIFSSDPNIEIDKLIKNKLITKFITPSEYHYLKSLKK